VAMGEVLGGSGEVISPAIDREGVRIE
jgi:hypothetical protein